MKFKKVIIKKTVLMGFIIIFLLSLQNTLIAISSDSDFTIDIQKENINLKLGGSSTGIIYINSTKNLSENISIKGEWIGAKPKNLSASLSNQYGFIPFSSNITFTSNGTELGSFVYKITAEGNNYTNNDSIQVNIISNNTININTDKNNYDKGERIDITGNITSNPSNATAFSKNVTIQIKQKNWKRTFVINLINKSYDYFYNISFGDPEGSWNITSNITDENNEIITNYKTINVTIPSKKVRYKTVWYSPSESTQYQRGETFNVSVFVTEDGTGVTDLTTNCILPTLDKINLSEIKQGYYRGKYKIPWDSNTGVWVLTFEGTKYSDSSLRAGGSNISIEINPAKINHDLISPSSDQYYLDEDLEIKVKLKYKDNTNVNNAIVKAKILDKNYTLIERNNGTYSTNYSISDENTGSILIEISSQDQYNNTGSITKIIQIIKKQESKSLILTLLPIISAGLIIIIIVYLLRKRLKFLRMQDVQEEIKEVKRLQDEAAEKYYKKGSISRQSYDMLRKEHSERLAELKGEDKKNVVGKNLMSKLRWKKNE